MMVSCPGCNTSYSLDERKIPSGGGHLTCRECGNKWKVGGPPRGNLPTAAPPAAKSEATAERTDGMTAMAAAAPSVAPHPAGNDSSAGLTRPVNCPKCGHFFVPMSARQTEPSQSSAAAPRAKPRILVVEDQHYFAELTCDALGDTCETTVASTLSEARGMVDSGDFDLVILDLSLEEGQDGSHVLKATRKHAIPVLIFTARDETELYGGGWDQLKAAGASDILFKGMNVGDELRKKVQSLVSIPRNQSTKIS